jgi:hypothetical protein
LVGQSCLEPSSQGVTLTPALSRKPGEGVNESRTNKGLFGAEGTGYPEKLQYKNLFLPNQPRAGEGSLKIERVGTLFSQRSQPGDEKSILI